MSSHTVALLSDFGLNDWYVGVMKAVVLSVNPNAKIVDIVHSIPRHNLAAASFAVLASYRFVPPDTVLVVVVDPGVGGKRNVVCARSAGRFFLAPDNGVLTGVLSKEGYKQLIRVESDEYFLKPVSSTFHGRDIFAPVAGHISRGLEINKLGPEITGIERIDIPEVLVREDSVRSTVQWVDSFGNLITNCSEQLVAELEAKWGKVLIAPGEAGAVRIVSSYESVERGEILGIIGSSGYLEISVREGNASEVLNLTIGESVLLRKA